MFLLRIIVDDVGKVLQEVVSATAMSDIGRGPGTGRDCNPSPSERNHQPRDRHRRPSYLQDHQDRLLPSGERAQVQRYQTGPSDSADAQEQRVDEFDMKFSIGCPKHNGPK